MQFFANERVPDYHAWAWARDGEIVRAYCVIGMWGTVAQFVGTPTADEVELAVGTRGPKPARETWSEEEWDRWMATTPSERHVMAMADRWSVDPRTIDDAAVTAPGIFGLPPSVQGVAH